VFGLFVGVQTLTQFFAAFEEGDVLGLDRHGIASARIASTAGRARADGEGSKATKFDTAAAFKGLDHLVENDANDAFNVLLGQVRIFGRQLGDQFRLNHGEAPVSLDLTMVDNRKGFKGLQEEKYKVRLI
jgi:hypothetical protein